MTKPTPDAQKDFNRKKAAKPDPNVVQRLASDPAASVWVTASAGTGKTKVLTDRVLRLMLNGSAPDEILCITFTKAAAALMTIRIREELSQWATLPTEALTEKLTKLQGRKPKEDEIVRARRLFAEYLDAHGGMRIQTIHSFSQGLLKRFPIESGVPPYFEVMDDQTAAEMLRASRADILRQVQKHPNTPLAQAVRMITPEVSEDDFISLIGQLTYRRGELISTIERFGGLEETIEAVYAYLDAPEGMDSKTLNDMLNDDHGLFGDAPNLDALHEAADILATGTPTELEKAKLIKAWLLHPEQRVEMFWDYASVFLTADQVLRKKLTTQKTVAAEEALRLEGERLMRGIETISTMNVARGTEAILRLTSAILDTYSARKKSLNLLDYDDLIHTANVMLQKEGAASWLLQKLPGDLKHILVDEAQDTNPDQWQLVSALIKEFFKPDAHKNLPEQTLFVVGDEKQSIFSFQRADPREFARRKKMFADLVKASGGVWRNLEMEIAFRSSPAITQAVDAVFAQPEASDGLFCDGEDDGNRRVHHDPFRQGQSGLVEVHPLIVAKPGEEPTPWALPTEVKDASDPAGELADKIADQIKDWLQSKEKLASRNRAIIPSDIMILVRRRSAFVDQLVRALKKRDVPVSGADRMSLREQIVVMDLVALGEWLLFPRDDYKLACVLKSPLIGLNDQQLEDIAAGRKVDLWSSLQAAAEKPNAPAVFKDATAYLTRLKDTCTSERPYEFYSSILMNTCPGNAGTGQQSGAAALYARLGFEAEDPLVEFMNALERFEKLNPSTLQGFIAWLDAGEAEVKREINLSPDSPRVNIMTVHGAKGLEAPIVILPDTTGLPEDNTRARPRFLWPEGNREVPLWVPRADLENNVFKRERELAEVERDREYRRLLYVAMTRAADRLYVYGYQNSGRETGASWYDLIKKGLETNLAAALLDEETGILKFEVAQSAKPQPDGIKPQTQVTVVGIPQWARNTPPTEENTQPARFRPSQETETKPDDKANNDNKPKTPSPLDKPRDDYAIRLGHAVHSLLEFLPEIAPADRTAAMTDFLARPEYALKPADQKYTARNITRLLQDRQFGPVFGAQSRPEVSVTGRLWQDGKPVALSGQVDRLVINKDSVTIVDYKNGWKVPEKAEDAGARYIAQMAAYRLALQQVYPDKEIRCALLWTRKAQLMEMPAGLLDEAVKAMRLSAVDPACMPAPAARKSAGPKPKR